jgi:hypothetical protein
MATATATEAPPSFDETDMEALRLAFARFQASSKVRAAQLDSMARDRGWVEAAVFAASCCQRSALRLKPWQSPPCWVADENEPRVGEEDAARLLRRMLKAGYPSSTRTPWRPWQRRNDRSPDENT